MELRVPKQHHLEEEDILAHYNQIVKNQGQRENFESSVAKMTPYA